MKNQTLSNLFLLFVTFCYVNTLLPIKAHAEPPCLIEMRERFKGIPQPLRAIVQAYKWARNFRNRAQAAKVQEVLRLKFEESKTSGKTWEEFLKDWELDVQERMFGNKGKLSRAYPKVEEMLALMAAKSPTFAGALRSFLNNHGRVTYKFLAIIKETLREGGKVDKVKPRARNLWRTKLKLPTRQALTPEEFVTFQTEVGIMMMNAMHPNKFWGPWIKSFFSLEVNMQTGKLHWPILKNFVQEIQLLERLELENFGKAVADEAGGGKIEIKPLDLERMLHYGLTDTFLNAIFDVVQSRPKLKEMTKKWKLEGTNELEINAYTKEFLEEFRNDPVVRQRVRELAIAAKFFLKPAITALMIYWSYQTVDGVLGIYTEAKAAEAKMEEFEKKCREAPEKYPDLCKIERHELADNAAEDHLEKVITAYTLKIRELEEEIAKNDPKLSTAEIEEREKDIKQMRKKIKTITELQLSKQRSQEAVHP